MATDHVFFTTRAWETMGNSSRNGGFCMATFDYWRDLGSKDEALWGVEDLGRVFHEIFYEDHGILKVNMMANRWTFRCWWMNSCTYFVICGSFLGIWCWRCVFVLSLQGPQARNDDPRWFSHFSMSGCWKCNSEHVQSWVRYGNDKCTESKF